MLSFYTFMLFGVLQLLPAKSFLMNTDKPPSTHASFGSDANTIAYMMQRMDHLEVYIHHQNKTLESQAHLIEQLLNFTKQSPSVQILSNEVAVLQVYVQRIMDEYHRLSNISDATDLAFKINRMATSVKLLIVSLTNQEQTNTEFRNQISLLSRNLSSLSGQTTNQVTSLSQFLSALNRSLTTVSSLEHQNQNQLSTLTNDVHTIQSRISSMQNTISNNQQQISSLSHRYSALSTTMHDIQSRISALEGVTITGTRLTGGNVTGEGRVEVRYKNDWGTVCDDGFKDANAKVVCRHLGYEWSHATYKGSAAFGRGTGNIVLDDVSCTGDENSLMHCKHRNLGNNDCSHSEDVGVICFGIRLRGSSSRQGRVEVKVGNTWGTVCDDGWDTQDAQVVCRTLGYSGSATAYSNAHFGEGSGTIMMDDVSCSGSERSLALCPFNGFGHENCGHSEDAGVICH